MFYAHLFLSVASTAFAGKVFATLARSKATRCTCVRQMEACASTASACQTFATKNHLSATQINVRPGGRLPYQLRSLWVIPPQPKLLSASRTIKLTLYYNFFCLLTRGNYILSYCHILIGCIKAYCIHYFSCNFIIYHNINCIIHFHIRLLIDYNILFAPITADSQISIG